jgi:hypothetical protein
VAGLSSKAQVFACVAHAFLFVDGHGEFFPVMGTTDKMTQGLCQ